MGFVNPGSERVLTPRDRSTTKLHSLLRVQLRRSILAGILASLPSLSVCYNQLKRAWREVVGTIRQLLLGCQRLYRRLEPTI